VVGTSEPSLAAAAVLPLPTIFFDFGAVPPAVATEFAPLGFRVLDVGGAGDCQFLVLAHQLEEVLGIEMTAADVRAAIVGAIREKQYEYYLPDQTTLASYTAVRCNCFQRAHRCLQKRTSAPNRCFSAGAYACCSSPCRPYHYALHTKRGALSSPRTAARYCLLSLSRVFVEIAEAAAGQ